MSERVEGGLPDNVVVLDVPTSLDLPAARILSAAQRADLKVAIVLGYDQEGDEYFASTTGDAGTVGVLLQRMNLSLLQERFGTFEQG